MHQPYSPRRTPNIIVQKGELFYWAEDEAPLKKTLAHYGFKQVGSASIYDIAAELSEKKVVYLKGWDIKIFGHVLLWAWKTYRDPNSWVAREYAMSGCNVPMRESQSNLIP